MRSEGQSREGTALRNEPSSKRQPPPTCHCEEAQPTWQSREGTSSSYKVPIKTYQPIASVAALTAQPLAALPSYGCGVPFTGVERPVGTNNWYAISLKWYVPPNYHCEANSILTPTCTKCRCSAGAGCPLPYNGVCGRRQCAQICCCQRRSLTATTDAIGFYVFNGSLYELQVPSRDCHGREAPSQ